MNYPDWSQASTDRWHIANGYDTWVINPRGWLLAITAEVDLTEGWPEYVSSSEPLHFRITDMNNTREYGSFDILQIFGFHHGGTAFMSPLVNMNSATPYYLRIPPNCPPIWVYSTNLLPSRVV